MSKLPPRFPLTSLPPDAPKWARDLHGDLRKFFDAMTGQINDMASGHVEAFDTFSATPTLSTTQFKQGDFVPNSSATEVTTTASSYVVTGWICIESGKPGTWRECRVKTGN